MITAVDSSILIDALTAHPVHGPSSSDALRHAMLNATVLACPVVWAELAAWYGSAETMRSDMTQLGVAFSPTPEAAAIEAGIAWGNHRRSGGTRSRIISDFLMGAHASAVADVLLTRDRGCGRRYFGSLVIVDPSIATS